MITADCDLIREELDAFVDGELRGGELRHVAEHLDTCRGCADEVESRRRLGGLIRDAVAGEYRHPISTGLAAGVVARTRAESYFSWRSALGRAVEDWHWVIVGGGAVTSTFLAMLVCSLVLLFSTATPNAASLSSLGISLSASPGSLYAEVSQKGGDVMLVQVDTGEDPLCAVAADPEPNDRRAAARGRAGPDPRWARTGSSNWRRCRQRERRYTRVAAGQHCAGARRANRPWIP